MKIPLQHLRDMAAHRPTGYLNDVLGSGRVVDGNLELEEVDYQKLCRKYRPEMPSVTELVRNFGKATWKWVSAGFPVVSNDTFTDRLEICEKCEFWTGRRCAKCGCLKLKMWLETEQCPLDKWD